MIGRILILTLLIFCSFSIYAADNISEEFPDEANSSVRNIKSFNYNTRIEKNFNSACFEYSIDGLYFMKIGKEFQISTFIGKEDLLGLFCKNNKNIRGYVDVDWLYIKHNHEVNLQLADRLNNKMVNKL